MNWSLINSLIQIVANLAVIASVLFLAAQARQGVRMLKDAAERNHMAKYQGINQMLAENAQLAGLWGRGSESGIGSLSDAERVQLINFYSYFLRVWLELHAQNRAGLIYPELWETNSRMLRDTAQTRGAKEVWELRRHSYPKDFQDLYDHLVVSADKARDLYPKKQQDLSTFES